MSTALVALIRHVIQVDSPDLRIRAKATKVTTTHRLVSSSIGSFFSAVARRIGRCPVFQCRARGHSHPQRKHHQFNAHCGEYAEHALLRCTLCRRFLFADRSSFVFSIGSSFPHDRWKRPATTWTMITPNYSRGSGGTKSPNCWIITAKFIRF